jgi:hypothetical protein
MVDTTHTWLASLPHIPLGDSKMGSDCIDQLAPSQWYVTAKSSLGNPTVHTLEGLTPHAV